MLAYQIQLAYYCNHLQKDVLQVNQLAGYDICWQPKKQINYEIIIQ